MFPTRGAIALVTTTLAVILLISFRTPETAALGAMSTTGSSNGVETTPTPKPAPPTANATATGRAAATPAPTNATPAPTNATPAPTNATGPATATGKVISTPYGQVQVQITVDNGKITDVQAVKLPTHGDSGQISDYVKPILASETLQAQSAKIDIVSGATYTSMGYARSLQSALDQAGIAALTTSVSG